MARLTVREFAKRVGLGLEGADYIGAGVMLKVLTNKGIAKEVDRINTSARGRKSVVYEVPDEFVMTLDTVAEVPVEEETPTEEVVAEVVETPTEEVVGVVEPTYCYDEDEDEDVSEAA
jgi:hypothetical protein